VQNFTIMGNSLGDAPWSGYIPITNTLPNGTVYNTTHFGYNNGSWYVLPGTYAKKRMISCAAFLRCLQHAYDCSRQKCVLSQQHIIPDLCWERSCMAPHFAECGQGIALYGNNMYMHTHLNDDFT